MERNDQVNSRIHQNVDLLHHFGAHTRTAELYQHQGDIYQKFLEARNLGKPIYNTRENRIPMSDKFPDFT
jgi:hypothetical protein